MLENKGQNGPQPDKGDESIQPALPEQGAERGEAHEKPFLDDLFSLFERLPAAKALNDIGSVLGEIFNEIARETISLKESSPAHLLKLEFCERVLSGAVEGILPFVKSEDIEVKAAALRALAKTSLPRPDLAAIGLEILEQDGVARLDHRIVFESLRLLERQKLSTLPTEKVAAIGAFLSFPHTDRNINYMAARVLGKVGPAASEFLGDIFEVLKDNIRAGRLEAAKQLTGCLVAICPDLAKPESYILGGGAELMKKLNVTLTPSDLAVINDILKDIGGKN